MKKLLFVALTSLMATTAYADKWAIASIGAKDCEIVHLTSLAKDGNIRDFWVASITIEKTRNCDALMVNYEMDCKKNLYRTTDGRVFLKGKLIASINEKSEWTKIMPGSVGRSLHKVVCSPTVGEDNSFEFEGALDKFIEVIQNGLRDIVAKRSKTNK